MSQIPGSGECLRLRALGTDSSDGATYWDEYYCDVPPEGVKFRVIRAEWVDDLNTRRIYEVEILGA
jgi:hypothetical protein